MKTKTYRAIHIYLSIFFLPVALLISLTGILRVLGVDEDLGMRTASFTLAGPIAPGGEQAALVNFIQAQHLPLPALTPRPSKEGGLSLGSVHYSANIKKIEGGASGGGAGPDGGDDTAAAGGAGAGTKVAGTNLGRAGSGAAGGSAAAGGASAGTKVAGGAVAGAATPEIYSITLKTRSLIGDLIMLHKDKAGWYFSILNIGFGMSVILLYFSGLVITFFACKGDRARQLWTFAAGLFITIILAWASL